ncbi:MAG: hypothetical protein IJ200_01550 [Prevotella sp.]|nr:hypothetical protein [Prevotella sp.]
MKKFIVIIMLLCACMTSSAQTYCYKHIYSIDRDGVKSQGTGRIVYYTFVDSKRCLYASDKNGNKEGGYKYYFTGTRNNIHTYENEWIVIPPSERVQTPTGFGNSYQDIWARGQYQMDMYTAETEYKFALRRGKIYRFSSDFSKINVYPIKWKSEGGDYDFIDVYQKYDASSSDSDMPFYE